MEKKIVDIDRLADESAGIARIKGVEYNVRQATGLTIQAIRAARGSESTTAMYDAVRKCIPDLPEGLEHALTPKQATAIFGLATAGIEAVEAMFPNAVSPAEG